MPAHNIESYFKQHIIIKQKIIIKWKIIVMCCSKYYTFFYKQSKI